MKTPPVTRNRLGFGWRLLTGILVLVVSPKVGWAEPGSPGLNGHDLEMPPLVLGGTVARAHTQGIAWADHRWWVTARREDTVPRTALLLAWTPGSSSWDFWNLTPDSTDALNTILDHAGGFQISGGRLWIPLAESRRRGKSIVAAYELAALHPGQKAVPVFAMPLADHVGAVAVLSAKTAANRSSETILMGASWDTESVYGWSGDGRLKFTWNSDQLRIRGLGVDPADPSRSGVAVQDWKWMNGRLFASGLVPASHGVATGSRGRLLVFSDPLKRLAPDEVRIVPLWNGIELAREAMTPDKDGRGIWFLPSDLADSNRLIRVELDSLTKIKAEKP